MTGVARFGFVSKKNLPNLDAGHALFLRFQAERKFFSLTEAAKESGDWSGKAIITLFGGFGKGFLKSPQLVDGESHETI